MANPLAAAAQIGVTGNARSYGIPSLAVQWTGVAGPYVLSVFSNHDKNTDATLQTGVDNANEIVNINPSQAKMPVKFSAIASSTSQALAAAMATDLPRKGSLINVGHMAAGTFVSGSATGAVVTGAVDAQIETASAIVENASAKRSPENALIIEIDVVIHYNPDGSFKVFTALT